MRILLTGVSGQVGSALVPRLSAFGTVIPADRMLIDMTKLGGIAARLDELAPDVIVNPAAYTAVDKAEDDRDTAFQVNEAAPRALARWAAATRVPLIHFSTDYVFDGSGTTPWKETDSPSPLSVYGASKLAGELAIRDAGGPHLIVRTSWVYAPTGTNFLRTIMRLAKEREELRIVADQFGAPTSAAMIAGAIAQMFADPRGIAEVVARGSGLVHLAASDSTSWHRFAAAIIGELQARGAAVKTTRVVPIATSEYPVRAQRPLNSRLDLTKLSQTFGISMPHWSHGLKAAIDEVYASEQ
ncbi:dTDP-4-dehydrorhamnose reductase [Reyranella sp.]|uniref:dTDP-4-dehydrorhamnose reductase n=1 Tax=Reyranella sp. TaxID=1929291 RepID=UPI003D0DF4E1